MDLHPPPLDPVRQVLHDRLRGRSEPVFVFTDTMVPAASVWAVSRGWVTWLRHRAPDGPLTVVPGDSPGWVYAWVAGLWVGREIRVRASGPMAVANHALVVGRFGDVPHTGGVSSPGTGWQPPPPNAVPESNDPPMRIVDAVWRALLDDRRVDIRIDELVR